MKTRRIAETVVDIQAMLAICAEIRRPMRPVQNGVGWVLAVPARHAAAEFAADLVAPRMERKAGSSNAGGNRPIPFDIAAVAGRAGGRTVHRFIAPSRKILKGGPTTKPILNASKSTYKQPPWL
jgi:hypothetical protein